MAFYNMIIRGDQGVKINDIHAVYEEKDLKLTPGLNLNPPPSDGRCQCCGRHISELKPFGDIELSRSYSTKDALLVKNFRTYGVNPTNEEETVYVSRIVGLLGGCEQEGYQHPLNDVFILCDRRGSIFLKFFLKPDNYVFPIGNAEIALNCLEMSMEK